ncbi:MAG: NUDIX domain-containing protein [Sciscionella sp.]
MIRCVGAVVHDERGRLLLVLRAHRPDAGRWSLPGGRVEAGETDATALSREMVEETGLEVVPEALCGTVTRSRDGVVYDIHDYVCRVVGGRIMAGDDAAAVDWIDRATFVTLNERDELTSGLADTLHGWNVLPRE